MVSGFILLFLLGQQGRNRELMLDMKRGVEAKNYEALAKAEQLKPIEIELRRYVFCLLSCNFLFIFDLFLSVLVNYVPG